MYAEFTDFLLDWNMTKYVTAGRGRPLNHSEPYFLEQPLVHPRPFDFSCSLNFYEYYDCNTDPYQMKNIYSTLDDDRKAQLHSRMLALWRCSGPSCNDM